MEYLTQSAEETKRLGQQIADKLIRGKPQAKAKILALSGDLGCGKTTFTQGFAEGLRVTDRILSPTFILMRCYKLANNKNGFKTLYHLDLYRLEGEIKKEVVNLGLLDIWEDPANIIIIEWAEKIKSLIPVDAVWVEFERVSEEERKITVK